MDCKIISKPELVVFSQNVIGGVQSYYYNLLRYDIENRFSKLWILADDKFNNNSKPSQPFNTGFEKIFSYRSDTPFFHILKELQQLVSNKPGFVLASFPLELAMLHVYRKRKKTIGFVCHDEYFLEFAKKYDFLIDVFIVHNPYFIDALQQLLPHRKQDIYYLPYGIELPNTVNELNISNPLKIIVIARMQRSKGVLDVPQIVEQLVKKKIPFKLTMVGDGPLKQELQEGFKGVDNISFETPATPEELLKVIRIHDIFLLPSYLDGMPVSLMETMTCGLVPVLSDFNQGIMQIVTEDKGFVLPKGNTAAFASVIEQLNNDRELLGRLRNTSLHFARKQFDVTARAKEYYSFFMQFAKLKKKTRFRYIRYGALIDHPLVPVWVHKNFYRVRNFFLKS